MLQVGAKGIEEEEEEEEEEYDRESRCTWNKESLCCLGLAAI
jgi:hypothetical protein